MAAILVSIAWQHQQVAGAARDGMMREMQETTASVDPQIPPQWTAMLTNFMNNLPGSGNTGNSAGNNMLSQLLSGGGSQPSNNILTQLLSGSSAATSPTNASTIMSQLAQNLPFLQDLLSQTPPTLLSSSEPAPETTSTIPVTDTQNVLGQPDEEADDDNILQQVFQSGLANILASNPNFITDLTTPGVSLNSSNLRQETTTGAAGADPPVWAMWMNALQDQNKLGGVDVFDDAKVPLKPYEALAQFFGKQHAKAQTKKAVKAGVAAATTAAVAAKVAPITAVATALKGMPFLQKQQAIRNILMASDKKWLKKLGKASTSVSVIANSVGKVFGGEGSKLLRAASVSNFIAQIFNFVSVGLDIAVVVLVAVALGISTAEIVEAFQEEEAGSYDYAEPIIPIRTGQ
ncbi:hypothetical protein CYMTET_48728 [Cymbomonas tetramitiformis]|uniref:Uncharacterized protein n=1 Tax=Cymbomonas tetramitiformis TaxID=36881 RepID=A0AAE0BTF4_9CHLO|nr:hypothetical protein CYMTET_48728 [Cymbomonas tetramitiformis]|eukprot:gene2885-3692_t